MQNNTTILPSINDFKNEARALKTQDETIKNHTTALNKLAEKYGYKNWATIKPLLSDTVETPATPRTDDDYKDLDIYEEAIEFTNKGVEIREKIASVLRTYGVVMEGRAYPKEVSTLLKEVKEFEETNINYELFRFIYADFATIYLFVKKYEIALSYANASLELNKKAEDKAGITRAYETLSNIAIVTSNSKKALEYVHKKIEEGEATLESEKEIITNLEEYIVYAESKKERPLLDMEMKTKTPPFFDILFTEDTKKRHGEYAIRKLMLMMGTSRKTAEQYGKQALRMMEERAEGDRDNLEWMDERLEEMMDEERMSPTKLSDTIMKILETYEPKEGGEKEKRIAEDLAELIDSDPYDFRDSEEDQEERFYQDEDGTNHVAESEYRFLEGIYDEIQTLFNAIFPKEDQTQSFEDHVKKTYALIQNS